MAAGSETKKRALRSGHVVLLGAGASVEAGVPVSNRLTQQLYDQLAGRPYQSSYARLIAYLIAKLQVRNTKLGFSPFQQIDIEQLFEALSSLVRRDTFIVSEFVERWDSALDSFESEYDTSAIKQALNKIIQGGISAAAARGRGGWSSSSLWESDYQDLAKALQPRSQLSMSDRQQQSFLRPFYSTLYSLLKHDVAKTEYLDPLIQNERLGLIASLNYDLTIEDACRRLGLQFDYGLDRWPQQHRVDWRTKSDVRLLKLHGSLNWLGEADNFIIEDQAPISDSGYDLYRPRLLIFGGGGQKLSAIGPFLQFLYRFERAILNSGTLVVVGYSFRDQHINAIINRWRLTRKDARLVIIDPSPPNLWTLGLGQGALTRADGKGKIQHSLRVRLIRKAASEGIREFCDDPDRFDEEPAPTAQRVHINAT